MKVKDFFIRKGYVMTLCVLLMSLFERHGQANGNEEAFLRVLTYTNYKRVEVNSGNGRKVFCPRGNSMMSHLIRERYWGWRHTPVRSSFRFFFSDG